MEKLDQEILEATNNIPTEPGKDTAEMESHEKLANLLITWYQQTGNADDLQKSLRHKMLIFRWLQFPIESSLWYTVIIDEALGCDVPSRYKETNDLEDLRTAITICWQVFFEEPSNAEHEAIRVRLPFVLRTLTLQLYEKSGNLGDIELAATYSRRVLPFIPDDVKDRANPLDEFARTLFKKYQVDEDTDILALGIQLSRDAVSWTLEGHTEKPARVANLGAWLLRYYEKNRDTNDLLEAIEKTELAISLLDKDDFNQLRFLTNLAIMLSRQLDLTWDDNDPDQLETMASREGISRGLQVNSIAHPLFGIESARYAIRIFKYRKKLSLLEQQSKQSAERFDKFRSTAAQPVKPMGQVTIQDRVVSDIQDFAQDHAFELARVRNLPNFGEFLSLPNLDDLVKGATSGSIVIVNITPLRSDAIIIQKFGQRIRSLNLPNATSVGNPFLDKYSNAFSRIRKSPGIEDIESDKDLYDEYFLSWLWRACVYPILKEIVGSLPSSPTHRVWWIGTGIASAFPFHAAGNSEGNTLDSVISSYIPSITSLIEARTSVTPGGNNGERTSVTIVTAPRDSDGCQTPNPPELLRTIEETLGETSKVMIFSGPSLEETFDSLRRSHAIHFACYGYSDPLNPSQSYVQLRKPLSPGSDKKRLTVELISDNTTSDKAQIAFLSL
ncbi:TPR domain-containing protein [Fusarium napiforme]|uniref:TPR domain-containing protein n=1 Tax=Fusarium napiforme TaxID=42672 RepID=A0A8H5IF25_9HYPO|nr:TPR domain-containing protein [Fusarium napiforme]